jgi:hypothetical protein
MKAQELKAREYQDFKIDIPSFTEGFQHCIETLKVMCNGTFKPYEEPIKTELRKKIKHLMSK